MSNENTELARLRREMRWLDASNTELWWEHSAARRLVLQRMLELKQLDADIADLKDEEEQAHEAWMRASRLGSDDEASRRRCLQARYQLIELMRKRDGRNI